MATRSICPYCHSKGLMTTNSRSADNGEFITRRRRECKNCGKRFSTIEIVEETKINKSADIVNAFKLALDIFEKELNKNE